MPKPAAPTATAIAGGKDPFAEAASKKQAEDFSDIKKSGDNARRTLKDVTRLSMLYVFKGESRKAEEIVTEYKKHMLAKKSN